MPKFYFEDSPYEGEDADGRRRRFDGRVRPVKDDGTVEPRAEVRDADADLQRLRRPRT